MPEGDQDHGSVAVGLPVAGSPVHQRLHFVWRQVLAGA
jgi:hypothetical protein